MIVVIGTGAMGPGIAQVFALHGYPATLVGRSAEGLGRAQAQLDRYWRTLRDEELASDAQIAAAQARLLLTTELEPACASATAVVEAIAEDLALKQALFRRVSAASPPDALLASSTSALSASAIAEAVVGPERYINTHFAQPAQLVLVVEVIPGARTTPETLQRTLELLRAIGRVPVVSADTPGFIWSRIQAAVLREVVAMVREGVASVEDIDTLVKLGYAARLPAMGPFEHADLAGADLMQAIMTTIWPHLDTSADPSEGALGDLVRQGQLGIKSGRGFYDWSQRDPGELRRARDAEIIRQLKQRRRSGGTHE
jgi:3-hydroxybutyryl-CoA dehydrogenase